MLPLNSSQCVWLDTQLRARGLTRGSLARRALATGLTNYCTESGIRGVINKWASPSDRYVQCRLPDNVQRGVEAVLGRSLLSFIQPRR